MEAKYYKKLDADKVRCLLCPRECLIYPGRAGGCYARYNDSGRLQALTYGRVSSVQLDPIEKKPLHFFHPGSTVLSIGSIGCNLGCQFCQNWHIAHPKDRGAKDPKRFVEEATEFMSVERLVELAEHYRDRRNIGVAFTYNEPFIWFEYIRDAAVALRARGFKVVLVTNGYVSEGPLRELLPLIDAMNIDIKGFTEDFYRRIGGSLPPVLTAAKSASEHCHVEITNLLIPGQNTEPSEIKALVDWVADELGQDTPVHFSRYFPARRSALKATPVSDLKLAKSIAEQRLKLVVLGNV